MRQESEIWNHLPLSDIQIISEEFSTTRKLWLFSHACTGVKL